MIKKYSRQRELILNSIKKREDHPTVNMLHSDLIKEMPNLGIATIYRNLVDLCNQEKITRIKIDDGPDRFDGNLTKHMHFHCSKCNDLCDICINEEEFNNIHSSLEELSNRNKCKMDKYKIILQGNCNRCNS